MSRSFEQFKVASVRTSWQHVQTLFRVREVSSIPVHPSGRCGNTIRTPIRVRGEFEFPSQTKIWEDSCIRLDVKSIPPGHQRNTGWTLVLIMVITCCKGATVRMRPYSGKIFSILWKAGCTVHRPDGISLHPDAA
jgi:hypothetical protein